MKCYFYKSLIILSGKVLKPKKISLQPQIKNEAVFSFLIVSDCMDLDPNFWYLIFDIF